MKLSIILQLAAAVASLGVDAAAHVKHRVDKAKIDQAVKANHLAALKEHGIDLKNVKLMRFDKNQGISERDFLKRLPVACEAACGWSTICTADGWFLDLGPKGTNLWKDGSACMIWQGFQRNLPAWRRKNLIDGMAAIELQSCENGWGKSTKRGIWNAHWADLLTSAFANSTDGIKFAFLFEESQWLAQDEQDPNWHELAGATTVRWARNKDAAVMHATDY